MGGDQLLPAGYVLANRIQTTQRKERKREEREGKERESTGACDLAVDNWKALGRLTFFFDPRGSTILRSENTICKYRFRQEHHVLSGLYIPRLLNVRNGSLVDSPLSFHGTARPMGIFFRVYIHCFDFSLLCRLCKIFRYPVILVDPCNSCSCYRCVSRQHVLRSLSTLRRLPVDVLRGHFDVTSLAVDAADRWLVYFRKRNLSWSKEKEKLTFAR